jgi:hypothetical protein
MKVDLKTLMQTSPEDLAATQHEALKKHVLTILGVIQTHIENEDYDKIKEHHLIYSPAGDGYGMDNHFINFDFTEHKDGMDIDEVLDALINLRSQSGKKKTF